MTVSRYNSVLAQDTIDCFAKYQCENGMLPDVITLRGFLADNASKPPVFPWGILTVYKRTGDADFLRRNYDRSVRYEEFWVRERYDGKMFFYSAQKNIERNDYEDPRYESGWDNSPRWDRWPITQLHPIDLNCYMVLYYRSMAEMAESKVALMEDTVTRQACPMSTAVMLLSPMRMDTRMWSKSAS